MVGAIVATFMAISFFMSWDNFFGTGVLPMMIFDENGPPLGDYPWQVLAFLASFGIAALAAFMALVRGKAGVLMLIAGCIPFALIAEQANSGDDQFQVGSLPSLDVDNPQATIAAAMEFFSLGAAFYIVSAALLILIGLARIARGS